MSERRSWRQVKERRRLARGSMLFLCIALLFVILIAVGIAFAVHFFFFSHGLLRNCSESCAMEMAQQLNLNDHTGKLNNLIGHSRELVFASRQLYERTRDPALSDLEPLAAQLLEQSRNGAKLLASERDSYVLASLDNLEEKLKTAEFEKKPSLLFPQMSACKPEVVEIQLGSMDNVCSNVEISKGVPELSAQDLSKGYVKRGRQIDLYRSATNLKLPGDDSDLNFELASLPAPVRGTCAPIRLSLGRGFKAAATLRKDGTGSKGKCRLAPSALQVVMRMQLEQRVIGNFQSATTTINTACGNGGGVEP